MRKRAKSFNLVGVSNTPNKRAQGVSIKYQEEAGMWICGCDLRGWCHTGIQSPLTFELRGFRVFCTVRLIPTYIPMNTHNFGYYRY